MEIIKLLSVCEEENACGALFKDYRDKQGVICKRCGGQRHSYIKTINKYQCKDCHWQTTLRNGTLLEASKLPSAITFLQLIGLQGASIAGAGLM